MLVKKERKYVIRFDELDDRFIIVVLYEKEWHFAQKRHFESDRWVLLCLNSSSLTRMNRRDGDDQVLQYWFEKGDEMHAFTTTKEAFEFLIDKL